MKRLTTKEFISKAKKIHDNKYDYSNVEYENAKTKVKIICKKHGIFEQQPQHHLSGHECFKCSIEKNKSIISNNKKSNTKEFIKKAKKKHGNKYDYSLVEYQDIYQEIKIICSIHGIFEQKPYIHLNKSGCQKCANEKTKKSIENFIIDIKKIHGNKYDYSLVDYKNNYTKVKIICSEHGIFVQTPKNHIQGKGCPKCGLRKNRLRRIKEIERDKFNGNQLIPSYNPKACEIFDKISLKENIHIQHAMNGGEFYIKALGYWVDGYDDENNTVYEFDEKYHNSEKQRNKDFIREQELINFLECKFIRIKE